MNSHIIHGLICLLSKPDRYRAFLATHQSISVMKAKSKTKLARYFFSFQTTQLQITVFLDLHYAHGHSGAAFIL